MSLSHSLRMLSFKGHFSPSPFYFVFTATHITNKYICKREKHYYIPGIQIPCRGYISENKSLPRLRRWQAEMWSV